MNCEQLDTNGSASTSQEIPTKRIPKYQKISLKESLEKDIALAMEADERERDCHQKMIEDVLEVMRDIKYKFHRNKKEYLETREKVCECIQEVMQNRQELHEAKQEIEDLKERIAKLEESSRSSQPSAY
ncbi:hypothetical protein CLU79DRAFT_783451, partial [Phycomyces nitens]